MIYSQTFSTDLLHTLKKEDVSYMLSLHYLSALSISRYLKKGDEFILITDTKGRELIGDAFPYTKVVNALDNYPYIRPFKMSAYKLYSVELFKGKDFVHFDNDVYLFKPVPEFEDTLVQSNEGYFVRYIFCNKIKHFDYILPDYTKDMRNNYNPGVFGFTKDSIVRDEYFSTFLEYSHKNINKYAAMPEGLQKEYFLLNFQDVYLVLEEALLYYLCEKNKVPVTEVIPDKYENHPGVWGVFYKKKYRDINWDDIIEVSHHSWRKHEYCHLVSQKDDKNIHVQEVMLEIYKENKNAVNTFLEWI